jgi:hypothetical protein
MQDRPSSTLVHLVPSDRLAPLAPLDCPIPIELTNYSNETRFYCYKI